MGEQGGQVQHPGALVDRCRLNDCDLLLAQRLANDFEATGQGRVAEAAFGLACSSRRDGRGQRFFWVDEMRLRLGQCGGESSESFTRSMHGRPPYPELQSSRHLISSV